MKVVFILFSVCSSLLYQGISSGVSDAGSDRVKILVKKGDSVTLSTGVEVNQQDRMTWYFNNVRIAYINGVLKICSDDVCPERFRDRLKLDHQTGSLTIMNITNTDSGNYTLKISSIEKIFSVTVIDSNADKNEREPQKEQQDKNTDGTVPGSGLSSAAVAGICVGVLLLAAVVVVGVMIRRRRRSRNDMKKIKQVPELESNDETRSERKLII